MYQTNFTKNPSLILIFIHIIKQKERKQERDDIGAQGVGCFLLVSVALLLAEYIKVIKRLISVLIGHLPWPFWALYIKRIYLFDDMHGRCLIKATSVVLWPFYIYIFYGELFIMANEIEGLLGWG